MESDSRRFPREVLYALDGNYPFVDVRRRITVLSWLCDRFLHSTDFRNIIRNEGKFVVCFHRIFNYFFFSVHPQHAVCFCVMLYSYHIRSFFSPTSIVVNAVNRVMFYCVMVVKLVII